MTEESKDIPIINTYIVPTLNNVEGLIALVNSLYKYTPHNFRIISIFNGTDEDYRKAKDAIGDKIHLWIKPYKNLGFGKSMNQGIRLADTEFVTIANDDVEVIYPTWWQETLEMFEEDPDLMGFNPHSFINKNAAGDRVQQYDTKEEYSQEDIVKMKEIFKGERIYVGCCTFFTIIKKRLFDEIGLFDESFGLGSGEDYDLMVRAGRKGYRIAGGSRVMVKHWWGKTKDNLPKDDSFISNYDLIVGGNQNMERKWGKHIDKDPEGWSVSGKGGPDEPYDKDKVKYPDKKWYQIVDL